MGRDAAPSDPRPGADKTVETHQETRPATMMEMVLTGVLLLVLGYYLGKELGRMQPARRPVPVERRRPRGR